MSADLELAPYAEVRRRMLPGDVIAFGGKGRLSSLIKMATRGPVSHVGLVLQAAATTDRSRGRSHGRHFNLCIESTTLGGMSGVSISRLSDRLRVYSGEVWWMPLASEVRTQVDFEQLFDFAFAQVGKPYDAAGAVRSGVDLWGLEADEDLDQLFCSELDAATLRAGGAVPAHVNPSEVTPLDLVRWSIYAPTYYQLKGERLPIPGASSQIPA